MFLILFSIYSHLRRADLCALLLFTVDKYEEKKNVSIFFPFLQPVVTSGLTVKEGSRSVRDLFFTVDKSDNGANYSCNATNAATVEPLQDVVTLSVLCE